MGAAAGLIAEARKTLGMTEHPPGSNRNLIVTWYNANIDRIGAGAWCAMAVTYWAGHSGNLPAIGAGRGVGYAYTVWHAQKFQKMGRWHSGTAGIKAGDVVFFDWSGARSISRIDHVGVVEKVKGGVIYTIEGNKGDVCKRVARDSTYIVGYGRPNYGTAAQEDDMEPTSTVKIPDYWSGKQFSHPSYSAAFLWAGSLSETRAYGKAILAKLEALQAANAELVKTVALLAANPDAIDVDALVARIQGAVESIEVRLDVSEPENT